MLFSTSDNIVQNMLNMHFELGQKNANRCYSFFIGLRRPKLH